MSGMTNGHAPPPNISELARQTGYSRTHVRRLLKQGRTLGDLDAVAPVKIRKDVHDVKITSTPKVQGVERTAVDLVQLKRDVRAWTELHLEVDRLRAGREPYNPRFVFFHVAVAFFVLLAFAALSR